MRRQCGGQHPQALQVTGLKPVTAGVITKHDEHVVERGAVYLDLQHLLFPYGFGRMQVRREPLCEYREGQNKQNPPKRIDASSA